MTQPQQNPDELKPAPVSFYEKHKVIYAKRVRGYFDNWRIALVIFTQVLFYGGLWLTWNDRQAILLHLVERKFYIFGVVFWPQDVIYLTALLIVSAYGLFLVTAIAGRLFCGYACPQTVYTQLFMWIENWVEGDRNARIKLDKAPMDARKFRIKATKHLLWGIVGLWTGFTLVGYFTPVQELINNVRTGHLGPWETFWIFFYGGFTILMAGFMREQVCKHMCPYARFQSVMFDPDTMIITYDEERGEPRGIRKKNAPPDAPKLGDCVDCNQCVQVCPTGIDIRKGLQYECIGCAACIDVCDQVMDKVGLPRGLVRYSTENAMAQHLGKQQILAHIIRPRILLYTFILIVITGLAVWFLSTRIPLKVDIIRDRSTLAREADDGRIENVYMLQIMNTEEQSHRYKVTVDGLPGAEITGDVEVEVPPATLQSFNTVVAVPPDAGKTGSNPIHFEIVALDNPDIKVREKAAFLLPR
ncbi:MAG: cytochrome c oxidase accessory protein CcoG [Gammaproteobacteria bacterium]|nr:cytochrome c oxidase accessory protein CcoG [Gammaproteobacteria bacterium]MBU1602959.1 cytochrome c oxidase accessory protein CcoG [Gammaproteobacteria bacterium]MBU2434811.1 cytochrome c oxidase accessory protein CcoG [Gammaproteobacteria bacterium]MBU2448826.1 cytochrome c oxidase accessory protein CcoG [Gammaproteobacteria bacterium]